MPPALHEADNDDDHTNEGEDDSKSDVAILLGLSGSHVHSDGTFLGGVAGVCNFFPGIKGRRGDNSRLHGSKVSCRGRFR